MLITPKIEQVPFSKIKQHVVRAQYENVSSPPGPHLQTNPQNTHPPKQYHQEHFQDIHKNIVQDQNQPPNHESLGSLVAFQQRNHNQAFSFYPQQEQKLITANYQ